MFYVLGMAICMAVLAQLGMWMTSYVSVNRFNRLQLEATRDLIRQQIKMADRNDVVADREEISQAWSGYREFFVDRLEKNAVNITSVYLKPVDKKPISDFQPGQHLPLRFDLPGSVKKVIRCYSLSSKPTNDCYRISVKAVPPPESDPQAPPGLVSHYINHTLMVGDKIEARAPSGSFVIDEKANCPVILLAGGIGITPLLSMLDHLTSVGSSRLIVLFYGVRNSDEHAFKAYIDRAAREHGNFYVVNCYSDPLPTDVPNRDYHVKGFVSIDTLKQVLPNNNCHFYLCGPPPFMESLTAGLAEWEVPDHRIRYEAFGPATIQKISRSDAEIADREAANSVVHFAKSGRRCEWNGDCESILDLAEASNINLDFGCRAGSCNTCLTKIISGQVQYPAGINPECGSGECLACIAKPKGDVELDA